METARSWQLLWFISGNIGLLWSIREQWAVKGTGRELGVVKRGIIVLSKWSLRLEGHVRTQFSGGICHSKDLRVHCGFWQWLSSYMEENNTVKPTVNTIQLRLGTQVSFVHLEILTKSLLLINLPCVCNWQNDSSWIANPWFRHRLVQSVLHNTSFNTLRRQEPQIDATNKATKVSYERMLSLYICSFYKTDSTYVSMDTISTIS